MAARKPLFMGSEGFSEEMATTDSMTLGGLTMGGNIDMQSANKVINLPTPTSAGDAASKSYVDTMVITGGVVKEALFSADQLDNTDGINALEALFFVNQPVVGDTVIFKNATLTRTYTFVANIAGEATATDVSIETDAATALQRLVTRVNADAGNTQWDLFYETTQHADINNPIADVIERASAAGVSASRIYGVWTTQADAKIVPFQAGGVPYLDYTSTVTATLPAADPAAGNFGLRRIASALIDGEIHLTLDTDNQYSWNADVPMWNLLSGPGSIPDATSGSGGAIKGKVTFDSDKGLVVAAGVASVKLEAAGAGVGGLLFNGTGQIAVDPDTAHGIELLAGGVATKLAAAGAGTGGLAFDGAGAMEVDPDTAKGIALGASGVYVKLAAAGAGTGGLAFDASPGAIQVDPDTAHGIELLAGGVAAKLATAGVGTGGLEFDGGGAIQVDIDAMKGLSLTASGLAVTVDGTSVSFNGSGQLQSTGVSEAARIENTMTVLAAGGVSAGDPVYITSTNNEIDKGDTSPDAKARIIGVARTSGIGGATSEVVSLGICAGVLAGATAGTPYYLATGGGLATALPGAGKRVIECGIAKNATDLFVHMIDYGKKAA